MSNETKHPETLVLHAGWRRDPATNAVAVPIYQTTSYQFDSAEHAANLFGLKELGNIYTRIMNPTGDVLEQRVAQLEGGVAALALGSGQAASMFTVNNIAQAGDNFVSSTDLYGSTWNLFLHTMQRTMGIEVRFVDPSDPENFRRATDAKTRCYYAETLPNPKLEVFPIAAVAKIGPIKASGYFAWLLWLFVHIFFLIGFRNRVMVMIDWASAYFSFTRNARIVAGGFDQAGGDDRAGSDSA